MRKTRGDARLLFPVFLWLLFVFLGVPQAFAAEESPYEFDPKLSLTGSCKTSKPDPEPDPGCPEKHPAKRFSNLTSIAIDSHGFEYVASYGAEEGADGRIDIFNPEGVFVTELADPFGPKDMALDAKGNLYVWEQVPGGSSEVVRYTPTAYKPEEEEIAYGPRAVIAEYLNRPNGGVAVDNSNGHLFVTGDPSIEEFGSAEEGNKPLSTIVNNQVVSSNFLAVDAKRGRLYASSCPVEITTCWILAFSVDKHELLEEVKGSDTAEGRFKSAKGWISIGVDEETGDFFVGDLEQSKNIYQYNEKYQLVSTLKMSPTLFEGGEPLQIAVSNAPIGTENKHYLFAPGRKEENRALAFSPPKEQSPVVVEPISVVGIGEEEAELLATIKPRGGVTTYTVQYVSQAAFEEAGSSFEGAELVGEGTIQPTEQEAEVKAAISGLEPGVEYRIRVLAKNKVGEDEQEASFITYEDAPISSVCSNQALRLAYSALLPDCRAYELVTPANTNGQLPTGINSAGDNFASVKASPNGNVATFLTHGGAIPGLGGTGSFNGDLYRTTRSAKGWNTESAGPTGAETSNANQGSTSPDQGYSFWVATEEGSAVIEGEATHYVRYPDGHSALVGRGSEGTDPQAFGKLITENGTHIVFETRAISKHQPVKLEPDAPETGTAAIYDRTADGVTHVASLLPGNEPQKAGENAQYVGASRDGAGIAFRINTTLYLRAGSETYEIGQNIPFAGVAEEGSRIFYVEGGDLLAFDVASEEVIHFSEVGSAIPVNVAPDGARAYFVSTTAIEGSGENPNGASAESGGQNLYLSEEGSIRFVATVTERDVKGRESANSGQVDGLGLWADAVEGKGLVLDPSRLNPDGRTILFSSRADLDGYDPEGAPEIYRYDSTGERLDCISCIPTRTPASGGSTLQSLSSSEDVAAPLSASVFVQNLRSDGNRAIFQSTEALVSRDNDDLQDVYEWEAQGIGSCTNPGGCVYLISSGHSAKNNYLYGTSGSGNDIFFTTSDILVGNDDNTVSIYDARVGGGFAEPVEEPCQGEGCHHDLAPPPALPPLVTGSTGKTGNVLACPKGKHKVIRNGAPPKARQRQEERSR